MVWYRASLRGKEPRSLLHYYACKSCAHVATVTQTVGQADSAPTYYGDQEIADAAWKRLRAAE